MTRSLSVSQEARYSPCRPGWFRSVAVLLPLLSKEGLWLQDESPRQARFISTANSVCLLAFEARSLETLAGLTHSVASDLPPLTPRCWDRRRAPPTTSGFMRLWGLNSGLCVSFELYQMSHIPGLNRDCFTRYVSHLGLY